MSTTIKSIVLDTLLSALITLVGGGNFYSFLFLFVVLFIPVIALFVSFDIAKNSFKKSSDNDAHTKENPDKI